MPSYIAIVDECSLISSATEVIINTLLYSLLLTSYTEKRIATTERKSTHNYDGIAQLLIIQELHDTSKFRALGIFSKSSSRWFSCNT